MRSLCPFELQRLLGRLPMDVNRAAKSLTQRQQECLALLFIEGHTEEETADILGLSRDLVSYHKKQALQTLRKMFQDIFA